MLNTLSPRINLGLCLVILASLVGCGDEAADAQADAPVVRPAKLIKVGPAQRQNFLNFPAVVQSQQLSVLSFEVGGMLSEIHVQEAQRVVKGELLAKLDQRDLLAKLQSARSQLDTAKSEFERAQRLIEQDAISQSALDQRKTQFEVSKAQWESADKALQDTQLLAPFDGAIARVAVEERQVIQPGSAVITILGSGGVEAKINLPSSIIAKARRHEERQLDAYIVLDSAPGRRIVSEFKEAALEADNSSQTYEVTFAFEPPEDLLVLPGMNGELWLQDLRRAENTPEKVTIPLSAIAIEGDEKYVWRVDTETMTVSRQNVVLEEGVGVDLPVLEGLRAGDTIVAAGVSYLSEGMTIRPWSNKPQ